MTKFTLQNTQVHIHRTHTYTETQSNVPSLTTDTRAQNLTHAHRHLQRLHHSRQAHSHKRMRRCSAAHAHAETQRCVEKHVDATVSLHSCHCTQVRTCTHTGAHRCPHRQHTHVPWPLPHSSSNTDWHRPHDTCVHLITHTQRLNTHSCLCIPTLTLPHRHVHTHTNA